MNRENIVKIIMPNKHGLHCQHCCRSGEERADGGAFRGRGCSFSPLLLPSGLELTSRGPCLHYLRRSTEHAGWLAAIWMHRPLPLCHRHPAVQMEGNVATGGPVGRERKSFKYNRKKWENNDSCGRLAGRWPTAAANVVSHQKCPVALMPSLLSQWWYHFQNNLILI